MRSEQILGNPKEKIFGVEILTAKEKPLKKNIFPNLEKLTRKSSITDTAYPSGSLSAFVMR